MTEEKNNEVKNIVEAALMVANQPLSINKLVALFPEAESVDAATDEDNKKVAEKIKALREQIKESLDVLVDEYKDRGIELKKIDKRYRLQSKTEYSPWLAKITDEKPPRYSRAALETLAIIAYRQPVTRGDIEDIRGVTVSSDIIRNLIDREWIRQVGSRDVPGKPSLYGTTREFLEYFDLSGLSDLPTLAELRDLEEIGKELNLSLNLVPGAKTETNSDASPDTSQENVANEEQAQDEAPASENTSQAAEVVSNESEEELPQQVEVKASQLNQ